MDELGAVLFLPVIALLLLSWVMPAIVLRSLWTGRTRSGFKYVGIYAVLMSVPLVALAFAGGKGQSPSLQDTLVGIAMALTFLVCGVELLVTASLKFRMLLAAASLVLFISSIVLIGGLGGGVSDFFESGILLVAGGPFVIAPPAVLFFLIATSRKGKSGIK